ncbi:hypothetical protein ID0992_07090 [Helicobacter pylori]
MYVHIERDIENDECERRFENEFLQGMGKLREDIKKRFEKNEEQFRNDIQEDIGQFKKRLQMSLVYLEHTNIDRGFDFSINTDSGIDKIGLFASVFGLGLGIFGLLGAGASNFWNPAGLAFMALGLVGIVKSLWNFFSSSYQKSQQKKAVDKSLNTIRDNLTKNIERQLEDVKKDAFEKIEKLKALLNGPVDGYKRMRKQLEKANERLGGIEASLITSKQGAYNDFKTIQRKSKEESRKS